MTEKTSMTLAEALYLDMVEMDRTNPDWDYDNRLDTARRAMADGASVACLVELFRVKVEDLVGVS